MLASLVQGEELSNQELALLREEDDGAILNIDNESVAVEQAEFTVTSTADTNVSGTLRATIALANSTPEADTITFDSSLANETITLSEGNLTIKNPLTIEGLGSEELTINTEGNSRVFNINKEDNEENIQVTIQDLTISGGSTNDSGGGIFNTENLTLKNTTISGNTATNGGGIANEGSLTLTNSMISSNTAGYDSGGIDNYGGGIDNSGTLSLTNSKVSGNSAEYGGGIDNSGTLSLINSTVSGNSANDFDGGGINNSGTLTLTNSTISINSAGFDGGGIDNSGTFSLTNSTISGNSANDEGGGIENNGIINLTNSTVSSNSAGYGGGIDNSGTLDYDGTLNLTNSIVANSKNGKDIDNEGGIVNAYGTNIVEDGNISGIINIDPNLSPLQDNGGSTLTQVPLEGSVAIDAGDNSVLPADTSDLDGDGDTEEQIPFDQRGEDFDRVVNGTVDLGAVEVQDTPEATLSITPLNAVKEEGDNGTTPFTFEITRSGDTSGETTVDFDVEPLVVPPAVIDGQLGASPDDFAGGEVPSGTVTFAAGETSQTLTIEVAGDTTPEIESEEFENRDIFNVTLSDPSGNAQIEQATASGEILNDDTPTVTSVVDFADIESLEGDSGETTFVFTATLDQAPSEEVTVDFTTVDGIATAGEDYQSISGTLTFEQGETEQTIEVPVFGDTNNESDETFNVELNNPTGNLTLSDSTATGTILNDDGEIPLNTVILTGVDQQLRVGFNTDIRGTSAKEIILIEDGVTASFNPQSEDRVDVAQPLTDYTIERTGLTELALTDSNGGETITLTVNQNQAFALRFPGGDTIVDLNSDGDITVGNEAIGVNEQANLENIDLGNNPSEIAPQAQTSAVLEQDASFSENEENQLANNVVFSSGTVLEQIEDANPRLEVPTNNLEELNSEAVIEL